MSTSVSHNVAPATISAGPVQVTGQTDIWNFACGAIALLFVVYITVKGELGTYISLLFYTPPSAPSTPSPSPVDTSSSSSVGSTLSMLGSVASALGQ